MGRSPIEEIVRSMSSAYWSLSTAHDTQYSIHSLILFAPPFFSTLSLFRLIRFHDPVPSSPGQEVFPLVRRISQQASPLANYPHPMPLHCYQNLRPLYPAICLRHSASFSFTHPTPLSGAQADQQRPRKSRLPSSQTLTSRAPCHQRRRAAKAMSSVIFLLLQRHHSCGVAWPAGI